MKIKSCIIAILTLMMISLSVVFVANQTSFADEAAKTSCILYKTIKIPGSVSAAAFSKDGKMLAYTTFDEAEDADSNSEKALKASLSICDTTTGHLIREVKIDSHVLELCFSPDSRMIAAFEMSATSPTGESVVSLRDVKSLEVKHTFPHMPSYYGRGLAFSPDSKTLAVGDRSGKGYGMPAVILYDTATGRLKKKLMGFTYGTLKGVSFSDDGKLLGAVAVQKEIGNHELIVRNVKSGKLTMHLKDNPTWPDSESRKLIWLLDTPVIFLQNGPTVISGSAILSASDRNVKPRTLWKPSSLRKNIGLYPPNSNSVLSYLEHSSGGIIQLELWDANSQKQIRKWTGINENAVIFCFSPTNGLLATQSGNERQIRLLELGL